MGRYAVKIAYDGAKFHGSQAQPTRRNVHGEVEKALRKLGTDEPRLRWAGRTDAGVSARANVAAFETEFDRARLLQALTRNMEDAWAWAVADVNASFEPRHARERHYRYHLRSPLDAGAMREALDPFVGTHDFTGFCRLEPDANPVRTVLSVDVARRGPHLRIDVRGESFLWNQVRRMVEAARRVAKGDLPPDAIPRALAAGRVAELGTAPPYGLLLYDVEYPGLRFETGDLRVRETIRARIEEHEDADAILRDMLE